MNIQRIFFTVIFTLLSFASVFAESDNVTETKSVTNKIYSITIDGIITNSSASFVESSLLKAEENNGILLIRLNTPGGVLDATRQIVQSILASKTPVVTYVSPSGAQAGSAGIFITLAADYAVMDKGTNIGAAHPVNSDGKDIEGEMGKKVLNDTVAFIRSIAQTRGRDVAAAEKMVAESASYTAEEALKLKLINEVVPTDGSIKTLITTRYNLPADIEMITIDKTFTQRILSILSNPNILAGLLFLGVMLIGLEFKMPGSFVFAGTGAIFLILFGIGSNMIPINYLAVLLILGGIGLLVADIFVTSLGLLSLGGIAALFFGMRMLFDHGDSMGINISIWLIVAILAIVAGLVLLIGKLIVGDFKRRPASGMETMLDKKAEVIEWKALKGRVAIYGEIWNAESSVELKKGDEVVIESYKNMMLRVKKP